MIQNLSSNHTSYLLYRISKEFPVLHLWIDDAKYLFNSNISIRIWSFLGKRKTKWQKLKRHTISYVKYGQSNVIKQEGKRGDNIVQVSPVVVVFVLIFKDSFYVNETLSAQKSIWVNSCFGSILNIFSHFTWFP